MRSPLSQQLRRRRMSGIGALAITVAIGVATASPASARDDIARGVATVVQGHDQTKPLTHGGANTEFSISIPDPTCPGDSAHDQWRSQSFIAPVGTDVATLHYGANGPEPEGNGLYALFMTDTRPYVNQFTLRNDVEGKPGTIPTVPALSFGVFADQKPPEGEYIIGLACTKFNKTFKLWTTQITVTGTGGNLQWRLSSVPAPVPSSSSGTSWWVIVLVAGAVGVVLTSFLTRSARRNNTLTKEKS